MGDNQSNGQGRDTVQQNFFNELESITWTIVPTDTGLNGEVNMQVTSMEMSSEAISVASITQGYYVTGREMVGCLGWYNGDHQWKRGRRNLIRGHTEGRSDSLQVN